MTESHARGAQVDSELHRLIYFSRNRIPVGPVRSSAEIETILAISRLNNAACAITGALMFNRGIFVQLLEGARSAIEVAFERIKRDPRHDNVKVLVFEPTSQRSFPSWSMAFIGHSVESSALFSHIAFPASVDGRRVEAERILSLMQEIALEGEKSC